MSGSRPSGIPVARSSMTPSAVRTYGRLWPALASTIRPVAGSRIANRHVTNIRAGISGTSSALARARISPGESLRRRLGAQDRVGPGHDQRRRHALVGHVADGDADPAAGHLDEVVEVAADGPRRAVVRGDLPLGQVRQLARQELLLDEGRDAHLLLEALAFGGLVRPARARAGRRGWPARPGRPGSSGAGGRPSSSPARTAAGPRLRVPISSPWDTSGTTRATPAARSWRDGRRVQLEPRDLDRPGGGLEVGEERVGLGDVDGDRVGSSAGAAPGRRATAGAGDGGRLRMGRHDRGGGGSGGSVLSCRGHPHARASGNRYGRISDRLPS